MPDYILSGTAGKTVVNACILDADKIHLHQICKRVKTNYLIFIVVALLFSACDVGSDEELNEMDKQRDISVPTLALFHTLSQIDSVYYSIDTNNVFWNENPGMLQSLRSLKDNQPVLQASKITSLTNNGVQVVSFVKEDGAQHLLYIGNFAAESQNVKILIPKEKEELLIATYINLLTNSIEEISGPLLLKPYEVKVLLKIKSIE